MNLGENMNKIGIVILNYNAYKETSECVESIRGKTSESCEIVIVDNGSQDESGKQLKSKYEDVKEISVLINEDNLGFSKGMNVGFRYLKNVKKCSFICLSNCDVILNSEGLEERIISDYEKYNVAVIGPNILTDAPGEVGKNPSYKDMLTPKEELAILELMEKYRQKRDKLARAKILGVYEFARMQKNKILAIVRPNQKARLVEQERLKEFHDRMAGDVALNGAFLIFTPLFVKMFDGLEEITFLYGEEWLLYNRCKEAGIKMMYDPEIMINHIGDNTFSKKSKSMNEHHLSKSAYEHEKYVALKKYIRKKYNID